MALGAQDVQPSCRHHLFMFFLHLLAELFDEFARQFVPLRVIIFIFKFFFRQAFRQMFGIAAEHDVRSAPGHIGGDRHGLVPSGLRDDVRFAFMIFGVQDLMGDPFCLSIFESISDFSMEMVPTKTGWPRLWNSSISVTTALNFSLDRFMMQSA